MRGKDSIARAAYETASGRTTPSTRTLERFAQGLRHSLVLPGFWLDPDGFWQDPLPNPLACLRRISPEAWTRLVEEVEREA
jgi:hypothetical protein